LGSELPFAKVYYNTPQHTATHRNTLQHTATRCNTLQHPATRCNMLQHAATRCNTLQHAAARCSTLQHAATRCNSTPVMVSGLTRSIRIARSWHATTIHKKSLLMYVDVTPVN